MDLATLAVLNTERAARRATILVTDVESGAQRLVKAADLAADSLADALEKQLRMGKSALVEADGKAFFLTVQAPPPRVIVTGAVHISQAMAPMAKLLDLDLVIVDPRTAFATPERFPGVRLLTDWPDEALASLGLDGYTAFVALTHDPKIDDPALEAALRSDCFYIGALGSRKTHGRRLERLAAAGFDETATQRIHAPIGLDIGAVSPAEIALAILGEIVKTLRGPRRAPA
ncbi:MAG TPA: XdhC family protein [Bosea sp. (in: a-proteobacteria)]|jgi:xanthine dehydrogenase accessory factor|uniref:XdhC family protein n=1 Tax=Bosea sp. (in: a-proteobacteria) TaxID=1871050 RepID=UPI002DDCCB96|nr:XdhC family protein [Bosea sp. (in: a-proteobacteria)]HEV2554723.1 XdhC family protein [Bosea sp. (in: a-proteobacteria)]